MEKTLLAKLSIGLAAAGTILIIAAPQVAVPATTASPKPAASAPKPASATSKDPCGATKSKWEHVKCEEFNSSAPGDEYFGRMKMSYLGIDNTYKDGFVSAGDYTTDHNLITKLDFATEALRRWAAKYPNDPQLARSYYLAVQTLRKVYTEHEQEVTWEFMELIVHKYPNTYFGKSVKAQMDQGFTEHWFGSEQDCIPASDQTSLAVTRVSGTSAPADPPAASAPKAGQPAVQVIAPPCPASPVPQQQQ